MKNIKEKINHITVVIEDVYQVHNASSVIRTCAGLGLDSIHIIEKDYQFKIDSERTLHAEEHINIYYYDDSLSCLNLLKKQGYKIVSTTPHNDDFDLEDLPLDNKIALFFGTERKGLSSEVIENSDLFMKIPMYGFTESLNISVCTAISVNYLVRKLNSVT